MAYRATF